ncbi:uncharacterized protein HD556DRAFT_1314690 [Suillus plorans]|uniref:Ion transport domain-containing protein n=1 Tax=Suillus plorans TaxID=116603 RepID=A0A9P7D986_9AGAM|nr:uncharacterized protein HD556DRAFT_1314690 [Suillus plorans]KAG1784890.1 hypothetical protein HD556DRAFT_1314690 [Suillus plorans]
MYATSFWLSFALAMAGVERGSHHVAVFRAMTVLRIARLLAITSGTTTIMQSLKITRPLLTNVAYFVVFAAVLFSIIGIQSFKGSFRRNCYLQPTLGENQTQITQYCSGYIDPGTLKAIPYLQLDGISDSAVEGYICPLEQWSPIIYAEECLWCCTDLIEEQEEVWSDGKHISQSNSLKEFYTHTRWCWVFLALTSLVVQATASADINSEPHPWLTIFQLGRFYRLTVFGNLYGLVNMMLFLLLVNLLAVLVCMELTRGDGSIGLNFGQLWNCAELRQKAFQSPAYVEIHILDNLTATGRQKNIRMDLKPYITAISRSQRSADFASLKHPMLKYILTNHNLPYQSHHVEESTNEAGGADIPDADAPVPRWGKKAA